MSFEIAVQTAVYNALVANADIVANSVPVYDQVPQPDSVTNDGFPYIVIGNDNHVNIDTDSENMNQVSIVVHTWSRYGGRKDIKTVQGYIYNALHRATLAHNGYKFVNIMQQDSTSFEENDGFTRHGVQTFNLIIEEI